MHTLRCWRSGLTALTVRKLESIGQDLTKLTEQGRMEGFFNNVNNADKLANVVEDIRDTMMEYQVCM